MSHLCVNSDNDALPQFEYDTEYDSLCAWMAVGSGQEA